MENLNNHNEDLMNVENKEKKKEKEIVLDIPKENKEKQAENEINDKKEEIKKEYFYSDVSAKTGNNIILAFDNLKKSIMDNLKMKEKNKKDKNINGGKAPKKKLNGDIRDKDIQNIGQNKSNKCC